ncbi:MAG: DUF3307 domain-containing protein [Deltaproteobacteria bacterium]|nr:DUF3307 domain-containing protein [Deltaproteobacteria bacterium]
MTLSTFFPLLLSHVMGDAVFTSYRLAVRKRSRALADQLLAISYHSLIHAVFAGLFLLLLGKLWLKGALLVLALHFSIDFLRCRVEVKLYGPGRIHVKRSELIDWISGKNREEEKMQMSKVWPWFFIHLLDQGAHLGSLYGIAMVV